jgi:hypothetical protein
MGGLKNSFLTEGNKGNEEGGCAASLSENLRAL